MKVLVYNVAASESGALTILDDFYNSVTSLKSSDIEWYFVISRGEYYSTPNVKVILVPNVKKSFLHRVYFENVNLEKIIIDNNIDVVFSMQNLAIRTNKPQVVYLQNAIPFTDYKFSFFSQSKLWMYKHLYRQLVLRSLRKSNLTIVQTKSMKCHCEKYTKNMIKVAYPNIEINYRNENVISDKSFIFPATPYVYKNHKIILEACKNLKARGISNYKVIFTICGDENKYARSIKRTIEDYNLPVQLVGYLNKNELYKQYSNSVLIFPSKLETVGLPILEAKFFKKPILVINQEFSKEALSDYDFAMFFDGDNTSVLEDYMHSIIMEGYTLCEYSKRNHDSLLSIMIEYLEECRNSKNENIKM